MSFAIVFISWFGKKGKDGFRNEFSYMILLKEKNYFKYHYFKKGVFQTIQLYLLSYSVRSDSPQLFFQDLTGRQLVPAVCAGPALHRLLYVCWISLHFVLTLAAAVVKCLGLYLIWLHLLLIVMYYLKSIVLCFRQALCNVCFIIAFDKCYSAKNF